MRGLIVGLGSIGRRHARNWAALGLGPLDVCHRGDDLRVALANRPDVVLVTNPTSLHVDTACVAIEAGAHVLIEKPLGSSLNGVHQLLDGARQAVRKVMVGYNYRFHPGLARLRYLMKAGAIGKVVGARAEAGEYLPDWHPDEDYRLGYSARRDLGGGPLLTLSHELDSLCWLLGAPRRITAFAAHASRLDVDTEDVAEIVLEMPNGALASVHVDYVRRPPQRTLELVGEDGVLRWEYEANRLLRYAPATRQWRIEEGDPRFDRNQMYLDELRHGAAYVQGDAAGPLASGEQGAAILAIALAALRSAHDGQAVNLQAEEEPVPTWLTSLGR